MLPTPRSLSLSYFSNIDDPNIIALCFFKHQNNSASTQIIHHTSVLVCFPMKIHVESANNFKLTMTSTAAMGDIPTHFKHMETIPPTLILTEEAKISEQNQWQQQKSIQHHQQYLPPHRKCCRNTNGSPDNHQPP